MVNGIPTAPNQSLGKSAQDAPAPLTRVAAFGDSLMWGQGLPRDKRFSQLFVDMLPLLTKKKPAKIVWDSSRSGAQIRGRGARIVDHRPGRDPNAIPGGSDAQKFLDRYPKYFKSAAEREDFLSSIDETPASFLYGEVPAPFPTVNGQVHMLSDELGKRIDIVLVNGGLNDLDDEDIINPMVETGTFVERWTGAIRSVAHDDVFDLLKTVRRKCPNAIILYFGFFAVLSEESDTEKIRAGFKHEYNSDIAWWFNENVYHKTNVNDMISEAITRSLWFQSEFQNATRLAVVDANRDDAIRGPGIIFVPSMFGPGQSMFASSPFLWEDYTDPTSDPARTDRVVGCPRSDRYGDLLDLHLNLLGGPPPSRSDVLDLRKKINGPTSLRKEMKDWADGPDSRREGISRHDPLPTALMDEIGRIQHTLIASCFHPNLNGAKAYAESAVGRFREHQKTVRDASVPRQPGEPVPLEETLRRYRLRSSGSLLRDAGLLNVDSIEVWASTLASSDASLLPDIWLIVSTRNAAGKETQKKYRVNFKYTHREAFGLRFVTKLYGHFEPGTSTRLPIDTAGSLRLDEITGTALVVGPDPYAGDGTSHAYGTVWRPSFVALHLNGVRVAAATGIQSDLGPGHWVDFEYPEKQLNFVPPKLDPWKPLKPVPDL